MPDRAAGGVRHRTRYRGHDLVAFVVSIGITAVYVAIVRLNVVGVAGDLLFGAMAAGLLFCWPHTIAIWSGVTLLVISVAAYLLGQPRLSDQLGNLLFFSVSIGCLWALWNAFVGRLGLRMPLAVLARRLLLKQARRPPGMDVTSA